MEIKKGGSVSVENAIITVKYGFSVDSDKDGRPAAGGETKVFADLPEVLDESAKDKPSAQLLAQWFDNNKHLLPSVEKTI